MLDDRLNTALHFILNLNFLNIRTMLLINLFRTRIQAYEKGLVMRHGALVNVLDPGLHWVGPFANVIKYDVTEQFYHEIDMDLLMDCEALSTRLKMIEVSDNEIALEYKNGNFYQVLTPGRYAYWEDGLDLRHDIIDLNVIEVDSSIPRKLLAKPQLTKYVNIHVVESYESAVLHINGEYSETLSPGIYYYWNGEQKVTISKVDIRKQQIEISGQELLSADKASIRMSLFAHYQVNDIVKALVETKDHYRQLYIILQLGLREYVGQFTLDQLLQNKTSIATYMLDFARDKASDLGIDLINCGLRDIILPGDIKEIMNQVLLAEKKALANTIMRREETASTRSLLNTAKLMNDNEMLFKLKEMEYMEKFAAKVGEITVNGGGRVIDQLRELVGSE